MTKKAKIVLIEDDQFISEMYVKKFRDENYDVRAAYEGSSGLKLIEKERPDLVLLDIILPGIDGFEVLEKIKHSDKLKDIPVVLLTNLGQSGNVKRGLRLGAEDYIVKAHFTPKEVVDKAKKILENIRKKKDL